MHNLRATHITDSNVVTHLVFKVDVKKKAELFEEMKSTTFQSIRADLSYNGTSEAQLEKHWWHDGRNTAQDFWSTGLVKHSRFSTSDYIKNYDSLTYELANPILNGIGSDISLGEFLGGGGI